MKKIKGIIAAIICAAMFLTVFVPSASAQESIGSSEQKSELPEENTQESEQGEVIIQPENPEEEQNYSQKVNEVLKEGVLNIKRGGLMLANFFVSPLYIFIPMTTGVGLLLLIKGLPVGISRLIIGMGQVIGSPLIALF